MFDDPDDAWDQFRIERQKFSEWKRFLSYREYKIQNQSKFFQGAYKAELHKGRQRCWASIVTGQ